MNTLLFIIYTFVTLVCFFQIIVLTCEATRQKHQIEELQGRCGFLSKQIECFAKIADNSLKIDDINEDRLGNISDTLDLYKKLMDAFDKRQAQLNVRIQHLEADRTRLNNLEWHVTNLNALHKVEVCPTSTDKYDPLNPSGVMYKTNEEDNQNISDDKPETITFAKDEV